MTGEDKGGSIRHPVVVIALLMILGIFALIGAAIIGHDHDVLEKMGRVDFARGLITYLFAVVTIGTAVVLVVSALMNEPSEQEEKKCQRWKEILSLLLGVFGTIVGYYFGSETKSLVQTEMRAVRLTPPLLSQDRVSSGQRVTVTVSVSGGMPPYRYKVTLDDKSVVDQQKVKETGWIVQDLAAPAVKANSTIIVGVAVTDSTGRAASTSAPLEVLLPPGKK